MRLRSIRVRHLKGIVDLRLDDLSDRLNLVWGPNESGKSTLVEALHLALFERSRGEAEVKRALRSWDGTNAPEVEVKFTDDDGVDWFVHKRFLDRPDTTVDIGNLHLTGEAAEARLRTLLGTRDPGRTGWSDGDLGIWPLLWVRQGTAERAMADALTDDARTRLASTLAEQTGVLVGGPRAQAVLDRARALYSEMFTPTGRPTGKLRAAEEALAAATEAVADLESRRDAVHALVRDLTEAREESARLQPRVDAQRARVREAELRHGQAQALNHQVAAARQSAELAQGQHDRAAHDHKVRQAAVEEAATLDDARPALAAADRDAADALRDAEAAREAARDARNTAEVADREASKAVLRARRRDDRARLTAEHTAASEAHTTAARLDAQVVALQAALKALHPLKPDQLDTLAAAQLAVDEARVRLSAAGARVTVRALAATSVDGAPLAAGQAHTAVLIEPTTWRLGDLAELVVEPGATSDRRAALAEAEAALHRAADRLGVRDLPHARQLAAERAQAELDLKHARDQLRLVARDGVTPLRDRVEALAAQLAALADDDAAPPLADAQAAADRAAAAWSEARAAFDATERPRQAAAAAREAAAAALRAHDQARAALSARLTALPPEAELTSRVEAAVRDLHMATAQLKALTDELAALRDTEPTLTRERRSLQNLESALTEQRERAIRLDAGLRSHASDGLADRLADAETTQVLAEAHHARVRRRADACRALLDALESARLRLQDRFSAPVRAAVERHTAVLFPGSVLHQDERGDVIGLRTGGVIEPFDRLSAGARDQLGLLVRLGLAEVIAGPRRLPVVLDDALVNADSERRERMIEVLHRASDHLQVLVLTCHDDDFDRLGADKVFRIRGRRRRG
jgi:energy-coupling factor transporter ATP-binding protein EcfA2